MAETDPAIPGAEPPAAPKRVVRFRSPSMKVVTLADALECDGKVYDTITVCRLTIGQYRQHLDADGSTAVLELPMYQDEHGEAVPPEVMAGLSVPDASAVTECAQGFLNPPSPASTESAPA